MFDLRKLAGNGILCSNRLASGSAVAKGGVARSHNGIESLTLSCRRRFQMKIMFKIMFKIGML